MSNRISTVGQEPVRRALLSQTDGDLALHLAVASGQHLRRRVFVEQIVDDIQEPAQISVVITFADGDEDNRYVRRETDCVLDIEVLQTFIKLETVRKRQGTQTYSFVTGFIAILRI